MANYLDHEIDGTDQIPDVSISIVNTNNRDMLLDCLASVYATAGDLRLEIIVINNACKDHSGEAVRRTYPCVKIIEHQELLGFSTNNNMAFEQASGRYLMLLNDDTITKPGAFKEMVSFLDARPDVAVVGANLFNPDGSWQICYGREPNPWFEGLKPFSERLFPIKPVGREPIEVAAVCGAGMMVRSSSAKIVGFLDTKYDPLYSEEEDWCFRLRKDGWKVYHLPSAKIVHIGGATMQRVTMKRFERIYEKKAVFFRKHFGFKTVIIYKSTLFFSNLVKSLLWGSKSIFDYPDNEVALEEFRTHWNMTCKSLFI